MEGCTCVLLVVSVLTLGVNANYDSVCPSFQMSGTRFHQKHEGTFVMTSSIKCEGRVTYTNTAGKCRFLRMDGKWALVDISAEELCTTDAMLYADDDVMHPRDVTGEWREYGFERFRGANVDITCMLSEQIQLSGTRDRSEVEGIYGLTNTTCSDKRTYKNGQSNTYISYTKQMWVISEKSCPTDGFIYAPSSIIDPVEVPGDVWNELVDGEWKPSLGIRIHRAQHHGIEHLGTPVISSSISSSVAWPVVFSFTCLIVAGLVVAVVILAFRCRLYRREYLSMAHNNGTRGVDNMYEMNSPADEQPC